ncbi:hypothetical protein V490_05630 [Pseudogymnoascus sp. VKM F-3557]|nr:hypothetical protein V490_05630 [Pseudogymnoascus sp. VKM F-3557]
MAQHHDHLSTQFSSTIESLTNKWGFVVVRTAYADDEATDAAQWSTALAKLQEYALPTAKKYAPPTAQHSPIQPDKFALPVIADPTLKGASYNAVRGAFNAWVRRYQEEHEWESDVRRDCCLVVDGPALGSLLKTPEPEQPPKLGQRPRQRQAPKPWVVAVDAMEPATIPYSGGGPYLGWTRVTACLLGDLFEEIDLMSFMQLCPRRVYDGQLPLYNGYPGGGLIDPEGVLMADTSFLREPPEAVTEPKPC